MDYLQDEDEIVGWLVSGEEEVLRCLLVLLIKLQLLDDITVLEQAKQDLLRNEVGGELLHLCKKKVVGTQQSGHKSCVQGGLRETGAILNKSSDRKHHPFTPLLSPASLEHQKPPSLATISFHATLLTSLKQLKEQLNGVHWLIEGAVSMLAP